MAVGERFRLTWVLRGELLLGPAPVRPEHLDRLEQQGVRAVLSLCAEAEAPPPEGLSTRFRTARLVLPDHRAAELMQLEQLRQAIALLEQLRAGSEGAVFVHCLAAMERSPLVCLAWLMGRRGLNRIQALDYLMQVHPGTSPLPAQLALLEQLP